MIDVIFGFDVEDPVNTASDDALLRLCRIFSEEETAASLFIAGEKARLLRARGRRDVLEAMRNHEICYHGNYWGDFPVPAMEYGQDLSWDDAVAYALRVETPGLRDIAEITGKFPVAWCVHQAQWCPQMAYALKLSGVQCCAGGPRGWFMNWLSWGRAGCTLSSQMGWDQSTDPTRRENVKPVMDIDAEFAMFAERFDQLSSHESFITVVGHPTCFVTADWGGLPDHAILFRHGGPGSYPRPSGVAKSQPRSPEDQEAAFEFVRKQIRFLRGRPDVNLTTYAELCAAEKETAPLWLPVEQVIELGNTMRGKLDPVLAFGTSFSCADVAGMLTWCCNYCWENGSWPEYAPVQRLLGPVEAPHELQEKVILTRTNIFAGARACFATMMDHGRLPGILRASMVDVGPGSWLRAPDLTFVSTNGCATPTP